MKRYIVAHCVETESVMHIDIISGVKSEAEALCKVLAMDELPDGVETANDIAEYAFDGGIVIGAIVDPTSL